MIEVEPIHHSILAQQVGELGDIRRDPPRFIPEVGTKHQRWRFQQGRAGDRFQFDARQGGTQDVAQFQYCRAPASYR